MNTLIIITLFITSYLLGSIPSGYLLTKLVKNDDIRNHGSQSTGATNTTRVLGLKYGIIAMLFDGLKGIIVPITLTLLNLTSLYNITLFNKSFNIIAFYGVFAVIGHIYPVFLNFKGGKAVATSFGVALFLSPYLGLLGIILFIIIVAITDYVSLGSVIGSIILVIIATITSLLKIQIFNSPLMPIETAIALIILVIIIVLRHIPNIKRLLNGTENKVSKMKQDKK